MTTYEATRDRILELCGKRELTINKLATKAALPRSSLKNIIYGRSCNPTLMTLKMICDGLDITLGEFFDSSLFKSIDYDDAKD